MKASVLSHAILFAVLACINLQAFATNNKNLDLAWEVSNGNETFLPDIFYAERFQNKQIMPTDIPAAGGGVYAIDHVIYPTIGNPNLYVKQDANDASDQLFVVLRLEKDIFDTALYVDKSQQTEREKLENLFPIFNKTSKKTIRFFLMGRADRAHTENPTRLRKAPKNSYEITPTRILLHSRKQFQAPFNARDTVRAIFDRSVMDAVDSGLYDIRVQVRTKKTSFVEYHYNAVAVYDIGADQGAYTIVNVTDSQVSISEKISKDGAFGFLKNQTFRSISHDRLSQWAQYINDSNESIVKNARFITFNGDLHNGGGPLLLDANGVAYNYQRESIAILEILKTLRLPLFLTAGNHDGYVSTGHAPKFAKGDLDKVIKGSRTKAEYDDYVAYRSNTKDQPGGRHVDIYEGVYVRRAKVKSMVGKSDRDKGWKRVDANMENTVLYDGFYQWRRTYGPLYASFTFGRNHFVNINSFNLRQHRRTGWGMYTVNYGGGLSQFQMDWIRKDVRRNPNNDVVLLMHHDPRGGHKGKDYPYYFRQVDYMGMKDSARNYVGGEIVSPIKCKIVPDWIMSDTSFKNCMHDGLQEWMRPDPDFDCENKHLLENGTCDVQVFTPKGIDVKALKKAYVDAITKHQKENSDDSLQALVAATKARDEGIKKTKMHPIYSGYQLIDLISDNRNIRTLLLGHTHFNSVEMLQSVDTDANINVASKIVPTIFELSSKSDEKYSKAANAASERYASYEATNPLRAETMSIEQAYQQGTPEAASIKDLKDNGIRKSNRGFSINLREAGHSFDTHVAGKKRELAILRMTSIADMSDQKTWLSHAKMFGFTVFTLTQQKDRRNFTLPQINTLTYFRNWSGGPTDEAKFTTVFSTNIDRNRTYSHDDQNDEDSPIFSVFK